MNSHLHRTQVLGVNDQLWRYCEQEHVTFTRCRAGRKNDNPFVEGKNWSVVRRLVCYGRFDTQPQVNQLNELYGVYRLYINHFLPVTKLQQKVRVGSRVKKIYDAPKTPYQRVLDSTEVSVRQSQVTCRACYLECGQTEKAD